MSLYMYQAAYTPESWAAQLKNPQNRAETVGRALCEAAGGKCLGAWYCALGHDASAEECIADYVPRNHAVHAVGQRTSAST